MHTVLNVNLYYGRFWQTGESLVVLTECGSEARPGRTACVLEQDT